MTKTLKCVTTGLRKGSPNIFHGLRYREWMHEAGESCTFCVRKIKEDSRDDPDATFCLEKRRRAAPGVLQVRKRGRSSPRKLPSVEGFV